MFGAGLASVLHQFSSRHSLGLIATEEAYENNLVIWGNSFGLERFFTSSALTIEQDAGAFDRIQRVELVGRYKPALEHVRVCWAGPRTGENCGVCPKCILTKLNLLAANVEQPWPFPGGIDAATVTAMPLVTPYQVKFLAIIAKKLQSLPEADPDLVRAISERVKVGLRP